MGKMKQVLVLGWMVAWLGSQLVMGQTGYHAAATAVQPDNPFENVWVHKLFSDAHATGFVIWVKEGVPLHRHDHHSETVAVLEGKGTMRLGDEQFRITKGDVIFIPEGSPHSVLVQGKVLKVLSIQAPAFDGTDRVPLED